MSEFLCDSESLSVSIRAGVSEIDWLVTRLLGELGLDVCSLGDTSLSNRVEGVAGCRGNRAWIRHVSSEVQKIQKGSRRGGACTGRVGGVSLG